MIVLTEEQIVHATRIGQSYYRFTCPTSNEAMHDDAWHLRRWDAFAYGFDSLPGLGLDAAHAFVRSEALLLDWPDTAAAGTYAARVDRWFSERSTNAPNLN